MGSSTSSERNFRIICLWDGSVLGGQGYAMTPVWHNYCDIHPGRPQQGQSNIFNTTTENYKFRAEQALKGAVPFCTLPEREWAAACFKNVSPTACYGSSFETDLA